jgi:hypothetical protein
MADLQAKWERFEIDAAECEKFAKFGQMAKYAPARNRHSRLLVSPVFKKSNKFLCAWGVNS